VIHKHYVSVCDNVTQNTLHYRSLTTQTSTKHERDSTILAPAPKTAPKKMSTHKIRQTLL